MSKPKRTNGNLNLVLTITWKCLNSICSMRIGSMCEPDSSVGFNKRTTMAKYPVRSSIQIIPLNDVPTEPRVRSSEPTVSITAVPDAPAVSAVLAVPTARVAESKRCETSPLVSSIAIFTEIFNHESTLLENFLSLITLIWVFSFSRWKNNPRSQRRSLPYRFKCTICGKVRNEMTHQSSPLDGIAIALSMQEFKRRKFYMRHTFGHASTEPHAKKRSVFQEMESR